MYKLNKHNYYAPMAELVDATDSKSVELRFMSVRVGLGVPFSRKMFFKKSVSCVTFESLHKKFNSAVFPGGQGGPLMHVIAAKAVSFLEAQSEEFVLYQAQVIANAKTMAETFISRDFKIVSGGTDNHLLLLDLIGKSFSGKDADELLGRANITVNKNAVPNDPRSPFVTSGLRLGSPAITTRGFKEPQVIQLTNWICDLLDSFTSGQTESTILRVKEQVLHLCKDFPVYKD